MARLKFGIDVDGVLRNTMRSVLNVYNDKFNEHMTFDDFTEYDVCKQFPNIPEANKYFFHGDIGRQILSKSDVIEGSLDAFNILSEIGDVYVITSQHGYENIRITLDWLHYHYFNADQLCFLTDKSLISGMDYFIDDNPEKFRYNQSKNLVLIDMPYNRNVNMGSIVATTNCNSFERFSSLEQFVNNRILNKL